MRCSAPRRWVRLSHETRGAPLIRDRTAAAFRTIPGLRSSTCAERVLAFTGMRAAARPGNTLLLEALHEPLEQPDPDLVLADRVLDAVLEVGVVVDLHHH